MGMTTTDKGFRIFTVDRNEVGAPMRANEATRFDTRAMVMWRQRNFLYVDMRYGGTLDVNKYAGVCTDSISGCNALAIISIAGRVTSCFFSHSTADMTVDFAKRGVALLGEETLKNYYAVLVENYTSIDVKAIADVLLKAGLPASRFLVYTNPYRKGDQTFGVRFSDGLIGEVHVREKTRALTAPIERNDFVMGFNTVPSAKSEFEQLAAYEPASGNVASQYVAMFGFISKDFFPDFIIWDATVQKQRLVEYGDKALKSYFERLRGNAELPLIKLFLKGAYKEYHFPSLQ